MLGEILQPRAVEWERDKTILHGYTDSYVFSSATEDYGIERMLGRTAVREMSFPFSNIAAVFPSTPL